MLQIVIVGCLLVGTRGLEPEVPKVKIIPPAYMEKIEDIILYQSHAKIIFKVKLPEINPLRPNQQYWNATTRNGVMIHSYIRELFEDYTAEIDLSREVTKPREKRQIFVATAMGALGYFAHSVVSKLSNALFGNEDEIHGYIKQLYSAIKEVDQNMYIMQHEVLDYSRKMSAFQKKTITWAQHSHSEMFQLLVVKIDHDFILNSIDACKRKEYPSRLISGKVLADALKKLAIQQQEDGKVLAIPPSKLSSYLKLPIYDCFFSTTYATVIVNVPLMRKDVHYELFQVHHHKFGFQNQTCELYPTEPSFLATSGQHSVLITSHMLRECSVEEHKLCLIPEYSFDSSESLQCAVGILQGRSISDLSKSCSFRCSKNSELSISQIDKSRLIITNANIINITCSNYTKSFKIEKLGAVELRLQCGCVTYVDDRIIPASFYCFNENQRNKDIIYRTIPTFWSGLPFSFGTNEHVFLEHSSNTLDLNWMDKVPVLNLTYKPTEIPDLIQSIGGDFVIYWLVGLSVMVGFMGAVMLFFCIKLKPVFTF